MEFSSLEMLFKERRSIRRWKGAPVPEELLEKAIAAANWCPNSGGKQTYHCYVINSPAKIAEIGGAVQEVTDYLASFQSKAVDKQAIERWRKNSGFFVGAPVLIAVSAGNYQSVADRLQVENQDQPRIAQINKWREIASSRVQTVGSFVAHLLLAFHVLGLGAVWMAGPAQAKEAVERIIGIPANEDFVALVPVGYPDETPNVPYHKPLGELVTFIR